jgi:uncharacterized membrane protein YdfJ with MMPL/SSD domain
MLSLLTRQIQRRARFIVLLAVILTVGAGVYGAGVFSHLSSEEGFEAGKTQSAAVSDAISHDFPQTPSGAIILFTSHDGTAMDTPANRTEVQRLLKPLQSDTSQIITYYTTGQPSLLSRDQTQTYAVAALKGNHDEQYQRLTRFISDTHSHQLDVAVGGQLMAQRQSNEQVKHDLEIAELISLPLLALLLVLVFRGVIAATMPLMLGIVAIVGGLAVVRLLTHIANIDQYAINVITVLGLGLSVDYSLLMVSRYREELHRQPDVLTAVHHTIMTSGRTIFFSGLTVIISLLSLSIFPIGFLRSISLGGVAALVVAIITALTLLPAALLLLGHRINAWHLGAKPSPTEGSNLWGRLNRITSRSPLLTIALAIVLILAMAAPFQRVHYMAFDYRSLPVGSSSRTVAEAVAKNFGAPDDGTATVLYQPDDPNLPPAAVAQAKAAVAQAIAAGRAAGAPPEAALASAARLPAPLPAQVADLKHRLETTADVTTVDPPTPSKDGHSYRLVVHYRENDADETGQQLVKHIRSLTATHGSLQVGGPDAIVLDTLEVISQYVPWALAVIIIAMGLLLTLMLRSLLIPLQAIVLSGFGLLASFGLLVFIFQDGHLTSGSWLAHTGGLSSTILLLIFTMAFGLSMDYATFLYSRIREEYDKSATPRKPSMPASSVPATSSPLLPSLCLWSWPPSLVPKSPCYSKLASAWHWPFSSMPSLSASSWCRQSCNYSAEPTGMLPSG